MNLKKITQKDSNGNILSFEFDIPKANVPPVDSIPEYDHPGDPRGSDTVPAWLTPGENVVNAEASRIPGNQELIDYMNNQGRAIQAQQGGSIPTYAAGGGALFENHYGKGSTLTDTHIGKDFYNHFGPMYAAEGTRPAADTSWIGGILDALRFTESSDFTDPADMVSTAGALGPYQIMPSNLGLMPKRDKAGKIIPGEFYNVGAAGYNTPIITEEEVWDEDKARAWAEKYLTGLQLAFPEWSPTEVLRAYNWGPGNVEDYLDEKITFEQMPQEAKDYVGKVFKHYKRLTGKEFSPTSSDAPAPTLIEDGGIVEPIPSVGEEFVIPEHTIPSDSGMEFVPPQEGSNDIPSLDMPRYPEIINKKEDTLRKIKLNLDLQKLFKENPNLDPYYKSKEFKQKVLMEAMYNPEILNDVESLLTGAPTAEERHNLLTSQGISPIKDKDFSHLNNEDIAKITEILNKNNPNLKLKESVPELNEPLKNTIKGPDTDPNAPEVNPANYLFTSGAGINVPGAGKTPIPTLGDLDEMIDYDNTQEAINKIQSSNEINHDVRAPTLSIPEYGNLLSPPPFTEDYEGTPFSEHMTNLHESVKEKLESANNTSSLQALMDPANISTGEDNQEKIDEKAKAETEAKWKEAYKEGRGGKTKEVVKEDRANTIVTDLDNKGAGDVTQTDAEVEAKYKEVFKEGRGNKKLREDLKLPQENKVIGFFKSLLGDLWNTDEFKRAAVHYLGSRVLGYDHNASLKYSMKKFMTNYDTEKATRAANIKAWAGIYTPASLELYKKSGDLNDLIKIGATSNPQGTFDRFHRRNKDGTWTSVDAEKHTIGEGANKKVIWRTRDGGIIGQGALTGFTERDDNVPGEKAYRETWNNMVDVIKQPIQDMRNQKDRYGKNDNIQYWTGDGTSAASLANQTASFAVDRGLTVQQVADLAPLAYENMIEFARSSGKKPSDITPFLEEIIVKHRTGDKTLFEVEPSEVAGGIGKPMSTELFNTMSSSIETLIRQRAIKENKDNPYFVPPMAISSYINHYATVWNGLNKTDKHAKNFQGKKHWNDKALDDTTGFYEWLTEVVIPADFNAIQ